MKRKSPEKKVANNKHLFWISVTAIYLLIALIYFMASGSTTFSTTGSAIERSAGPANAEVSPHLKEELVGMIVEEKGLDEIRIFLAAVSSDKDAYDRAYTYAKDFKTAYAYVKQAVARGNSAERIKEALANHNLSPYVLSDVFNEIR